MRVGRLLDALLRARLDPDRRTALLSELEELHAHRSSVSGGGAADRWFRRERRRLVWTLLLPWRSWSPDPRVRSESSFGDLRRDIRFTLRQIVRAPAWSVVVIGTLALAIGANAVVFGIVDAVLLEPLPYDDPSTLVRVWERIPGVDDGFAASDPTVLDWLAESESFEALGATPVPYPQPTLLGESGPEQLQAVATTASLLRMLRVQPVVGRLFAPEETAAGARSRVVVLGHDFWRSHFASDPEVVGTGLVLDGESWEVIGVLPEELDFLDRPDLWLPYALQPDWVRGDHRLEAFGRLRAEVSEEAAEAELLAIMGRLGEIYPEAERNHGIDVESFEDWIVDERATRSTLLLLAAVGLLLLLACANVSNLALARSSVRRREMGLRASLGAGRGRLVRQLLTESTVLAGIGAVLGALLAYWTLPVVAGLGPATLPRLDGVGLSPTVLLFMVAVTVLVGVLCAVLPSLRLRGEGILGMIADHGEGGSRRALGVRDLLVISELALATVLIVVAGLLVESHAQLGRVDPGYEVEDVFTVELNPPATQYPEFSAEVADFYRDVLDAVRGIPGVTSAAASGVNPFRGLRLSNTIGVESMLERSEFLPIQWRPVTPGYFETLRMPVVKGRGFLPSDRDGERVVVVTESVADFLWPGEDPIGQPVTWIQPGGPPLRVVGVVGEYRDTDLADPAIPTLFHNQERFPWPEMTLMVRAEGVDPARLAGQIRDAVWAIDPGVPVPEIDRLVHNLEDELAEARFSMRLVGLFAVTALALAALGIYGVIAYGVSRRKREIGVRLALGADRGRVVREVVARGVRLVGAGLVVGVLLALGTSSWVQAVLFETPAVNGLVYGLVIALLGTFGLFATYMPARAAARVESATALRGD